MAQFLRLNNRSSSRYNNNANVGTRGRNSIGTRGRNSIGTGTSQSKSTGGGNTNRTGGIPKWKLESMQFRAAIREARRAQRDMKQHGTLSTSRNGRRSQATSNIYHNNNNRGYHENTPMAMPSVNPSYIKCQHCKFLDNHQIYYILKILFVVLLVSEILIPTVGGRSFNQQAAERHIPQCKNIINKPTRLSAGAHTIARVTEGRTSQARTGSGPGLSSTGVNSSRNTMTSGVSNAVRRGSEGVARYRR